MSFLFRPWHAFDLRYCGQTSSAFNHFSLFEYLSMFYSCNCCSLIVKLLSIPQLIHFSFNSTLTFNFPDFVLGFCTTTDSWIPRIFFSWGRLIILQISYLFLFRLYMDSTTASRNANILTKPVGQAKNQDVKCFSSSLNKIRRSLWRNGVNCVTLPPE